MADSSSSLSPEKRLLQLIESGGAAPHGATAGAELPKPVPLSLKEHGHKLLQSVRHGALDFRKRFGIKTANQLTRGVLIALTVFALLSTLYEIRILGRDPLIGLDVPDRKVAQLGFDEPAFDSGGLSGDAARNVFLPFAQREELQVVKNQTGSMRLVEMTKTLKLAGISFNPDDAKVNYCMIEDLQKSITVFLREGDRISGLRVARILEESVELEYDNETIEIR